ncbi:DUF4279 domain-containing protein [Gorillibacterium timonense]|uniref:DUF4279 domain-containing protein n=1 Tax=Gorillibacterium timonense TaxID=1689269 RepID=UPI0011DD63D7|nr:DUF4279 domain-containing protein [Gorillibacterium timonense]
MENTTVMVGFSIYGDEFNPQIITEKLNIQPKKYWLKGDTIPGKPLIRNKTCWSVNTEYQESLDINDQLSEIIDLIQGKSKEIIELMRIHNLEIIISIVINIENNQKPAMYLNKQVIEFLHCINAEIDIDLYVYS